MKTCFVKRVFTVKFENRQFGVRLTHGKRQESLSSSERDQKIDIIQLSGQRLMSES